MPLRLYNTLTRTKEEFTPIDRENVRMYVCGPTVYDYAHIGNARPVIVFDVLFRLLRHLYGESHVTYVRNITDIDDKINARAREEGTTIRELTERTGAQFHEDIAALGVLPPTHEPRATDHVPEMIAIIETLIAKGHAYVAEGHVLFSVPSMPDYGKLSRRPLDDMIAGARVDVAPYKKGDMDFVLWKPSDDATPGWDSPWGRGRPGWHIECSAMAWKHLGERFDIHGGGIDLIFPHHENEIAQTRCAFGSGIMADFWMHNGFVQVEGQKMSKSVGNFVTINELLNTSQFGARSWDGTVLRLAMLKSHYRQPIDWTVKALEEAEANLHKWTTQIGAGQAGDGKAYGLGSADGSGWGDPLGDGFGGGYGGGAASFSSVVDELSDDLNCSLVLLMIHSMDNPFEIVRSLKMLGIDIVAYGERLLEKASLSQDEIKTVETLISGRSAARRAKNWNESDRIRDELTKMGVILKDNKDGTTTWEVKR